MVLSVITASGRSNAAFRAKCTWSGAASWLGEGGGLVAREARLGEQRVGVGDRGVGDGVGARRLVHAGEQGAELAEGASGGVLGLDEHGAGLELRVIDEVAHGPHRA